MCGIGGKVSFETTPDAGIADRMNNCMRHRGPDTSGVYANGPAILAHTRLAILDLSEAGAQPMSSDDGSIRLVFNGEIYNYRELRKSLDGYRFSSGTDTEVLLHLYDQEGIECLQYLRGMFAFGIWDENEQRLFMCRDRLGQKPLYYTQQADALTFGSTIKSILADGDVQAHPDHRAIRDYLAYQYVPHPRTGFEDIRQLAPGEYAIFDETGFRKEKYWSLTYADQFEKAPDVLADELRSKLREATRLRMRSDVPLGVFLSGGVDSSVLTALMSDLSYDPVGTYSIGFEQEAYDELAYAREVANAFETDHHEYTVTTDSMEILPELVEQYEMPFGDPSALPTYYISQVAAEDVSVVLTGDAGDENFAGYDRYYWDHFVSQVRRIPEPLRRLGSAALDVLPEDARQQEQVSLARQTLDLASDDPMAQYARFTRHATDEEVRKVYASLRGYESPEHLRSAYDQDDGQSRLDSLLKLDIETYLPDDLLVKIDRASMAHSLEVRSPFLDHEVVQYAARIPSEYKLRRGDKKWLLKKAFSDVLPESVMTREKQGFSVPVNEWFRGELRSFARGQLDTLGAREPFQLSGLRSILDDHLDETADNGYRLWDLVVLAAWYERYMDS